MKVLSDTFTVVIADDEYIIRERLSKHLEEAGYSIVGMACDGLEAQELLNEYLPDIIITDIAMPLMSGIELLEESRKAGIHTKFIILTGYNNFDFAISALKNSASDYLLKPIDSDQLLDAMDRAVTAIIKDIKQRKIEHAYDKLKDAELLYRYFCGEDVEKNLSARVSEIIVHPQGTRLLLINGLLSDKINEVLLFALPNGMTLGLLKPGQSHVVGNLPLNLYVALSNPCQDKEILRAMFVTLRCVLLKRFFSPETHLYGQALSECSVSSISAMMAQNQTLIQMGDFSLFTRLLDSQVHELEHPLQLECYTSSLITLIKQGQRGLSGFPWESHSALWILERFTSLEECIAWFQALILETFQHKTEASIPLVEKVRQYLTTHYAQPHLNLDMIALVVCAHPNYISTKFKEETGFSVIEFLTDIRLEKAYFLLESTDFSCQQVSLSVGFNDQFYFSKRFKKKYGFPPNVLAKQSNENNP